MISAATAAGIVVVVMVMVMVMVPVVHIISDIIDTNPTSTPLPCFIHTGISPSAG